MHADRSKYDSFDVTDDMVVKFAEALPKLAATLQAKQYELGGVTCTTPITRCTQTAAQQAPHRRRHPNPPGVEA